MMPAIDEWARKLSGMVMRLGGSLAVRLGDTAGAEKLSVRNAEGAEVAWINSQGRASFGAGLGILTDDNGDVLSDDNGDVLAEE